MYIQEMNPNREQLLEVLKGEKFIRISKYGESLDEFIVEDIGFVTKLDHIKGNIEIYPIIYTKNKNSYPLKEIRFTNLKKFGITKLTEKQAQNIKDLVQEKKERREKIREKYLKKNE